MRASEAKGGWRAAAWLLERIFPADYHPKAAERERFQKMQEQENAEMEAAEAAMEREAATVVQASVPAAAGKAGNPPEPALHNSQNAPSCEGPLALAAGNAAPQLLPNRR